jgi:enoyl-CoA hydratase/carnithine racemase
MSAPKYETIHVHREGAAAWVTINNPPLNILDARLMTEINDFAGHAAKDDTLTVIVFQSADPDFFIIHGDMNFVKQPEALMSLQLGDAGTEGLNPMMRLHERLRGLPQITIGKLAGYARGGGAEFLSALDMRFAARGIGGIAQMEALIGIIPGSGGTAYLPQLVGRARSLEITVGAELFDADLAERYGWINRALPPEKLDAFVDDLAKAIASRPPGMVRAAKQAIDASSKDLTQALRVNNELLGQTFAAPIATTLTLAALKAGAQTREGEKQLEETLSSLN